ncbi:MAG: hypothetical protein KGD63_02580 [Candidatus Lokiarchaeota archaeon]|nr:hypothetical protein [Candidatus Lokiarchaeota archaeon]
MVEEKEETKKKKISTGLIIDNSELKKNRIFPDEIRNEVHDAPFYLLIFISREEVLKINCFPTKTNNVKKILIKLEEFSPDLVNGISDVLKELDLRKYVLHITGLCYEVKDCYYEAFIVGDELGQEDVGEVKRRFLQIEKVVDVIFEDIQALD